MKRTERGLWLVVVATAAIAIPATLMLGCAGPDDVPPGATAPEGTNNESPVEQKSAALGTCTPGVDCSTLGAPCNWNTTPPANQVYLGFHLNGDPVDIECRVLAWVQGVNNQQTPIGNLGQYFSNDRLFMVKVGANSEVLMTKDINFGGVPDCIVHGSATGVVKQVNSPPGSVPPWTLPDQFCSNAFLTNGVSSLVVQPTWYN